MDANVAQGREDEADPAVPRQRVSVAEVAVEALVGAAAGAATGAVGGPVGIVAGAVIGGAVGAAAGVALHDGRVAAGAKQAELDRDIGVIGGNIGEAPPDAPRSERGTFNAASMGLGGGAAPMPSEGMMQNLDQD